MTWRNENLAIRMPLVGVGSRCVISMASAAMRSTHKFGITPIMGFPGT